MSLRIFTHRVQSVCLTSALLAVVPALFAQAQTVAANGETVYRTACSACHDRQDEQRAPTLAMLGQLAPGAVITSLRSGKMAVQGSTLSDDEQIAVTAYITGRTVDLAVADIPEAFVCTANPGLAASFTLPGWNGWGAGPGNTRFQPADRAGLSAGQIPRLTLAWAFGFADALAARTQPSVVGEWLFTGGENGEVYALDSHSGCLRWRFQAQAAVRTAMTVAAVDGGGFAVVFGDGQANAYALDAQTGQLLWRRKIDSHPNAAITGAPAVHAGRVYVPVSAAGEEVRGQNPDYGCCTFRGSVSALRLSDGETLWKSYSIPEAPAPRGTSTSGVTLYGPAGAGIWGSPTLDIDRNLLYVGTGNGFAGPRHPNTNAIIAMDLDSGAHAWVRQTVPDDIWLWQCPPQNSGNPNCPPAEGPDFDFGTAPLLMTLTGGRDLLVVPQKSGMVYGLDPENGGQIVWATRIGEGSSLGGQWGAATDGALVFTGRGDTLAPAPGGMFALDPTNGNVIWHSQARDTLCEGGADNACYAAQGGAVSAIPGVVFSGGADGGLRAYASSDGTLLWEYDTNRSFDTVNGVTANGATIDAAGPVIAGGMLYVNSGYNGIVGRPGNVLLAFKVESNGP